MGDFYEMLYDDARRAAQLLDIAYAARRLRRRVPGKTKGPMEHEVVRVVMPGTPTDGAQPDLAPPAGLKERSWRARAPA